MPAARVVINSPTTHGAIGFSTDLAPSMTLGCGSWGGNVTSDNVSPIHLMDIKRVAFETKPVNKTVTVMISKVSPVVENVTAKAHPAARREEIAAIVDKFLSQKIAEKPNTGASVAVEEKTAVVESPVKTIIHELRSGSSENGAKPSPVDFVSEDDVRLAVANGQKIYITAKTILTPSARDLGEEKEIFVRV